MFPCYLSPWRQTVALVCTLTNTAFLLQFLSESVCLEEEILWEGQLQLSRWCFCPFCCCCFSPPLAAVWVNEAETVSLWETLCRDGVRCLYGEVLDLGMIDLAIWMDASVLMTCVNWQVVNYRQDRGVLSIVTSHVNFDLFPFLSEPSFFFFPKALCFPQWVSENTMLRWMALAKVLCLSTKRCARINQCSLVGNDCSSAAVIKGKQLPWKAPVCWG